MINGMVVHVGDNAVGSLIKYRWNCLTNNRLLQTWPNASMAAMNVLFERPYHRMVYMNMPT